MAEYFVYKRHGPFGISSLAQMVQSGEVNPQTFVWSPGMPTLEHAERMNELRPWFEEQQVKDAAAEVEASPASQPPTTQAAAVVASFTGFKVAVNGVSTGPFTPEEILQKISTAEVAASTLVWKPGMAQWTPAEEVAEFERAFAAQAALRNAVEASVAAAAPPPKNIPVTGAGIREKIAPPSSGPANFPAAAPTAGGGASEELDLEDPGGTPPLALTAVGFEETGLKWTQFIVPGVFFLAGAALLVAAWKTPYITDLLVKIIAKLKPPPPVDANGAIEAIVEAADKMADTLTGRQRLIRFVPGAAFSAAGIVVAAITVLGARKSDDDDF